MKTEIERIQELLPTELFEGSKDWREGNTVERVEWLLSMYASAKEEVARLEELNDRWLRSLMTLLFVFIFFLLELFK
jgi:hypothetical protein